MHQPGYGGREPRTKTKVIRLAYLPDNFTTNDVLQTLQGVGHVVTIMFNKFEPRYCFVEFASPEEATHAFSHIRKNPIIHPVSQRPARVDYSTIGAINVTERDLTDAAKSVFYTTEGTTYDQPRSMNEGGYRRDNRDAHPPRGGGYHRDTYPPRDQGPPHGYNGPRGPAQPYGGAYDGYEPAPRDEPYARSHPPPAHHSGAAGAFGGRPGPADPYAPHTPHAPVPYHAPAPVPARAAPRAPLPLSSLSFVQDPHAAPSPVILLTITLLVHTVSFNTLYQLLQKMEPLYAVSDPAPPPSTARYMVQLPTASAATVAIQTFSNNYLYTNCNYLVVGYAQTHDLVPFMAPDNPLTHSFVPTTPPLLASAPTPAAPAPAPAYPPAARYDGYDGYADDYPPRDAPYPRDDVPYAREDPAYGRRERDYRSAREPPRDMGPGGPGGRGGFPDARGPPGGFHDSHGGAPGGNPCLVNILNAPTDVGATPDLYFYTFGALADVSKVKISYKNHSHVLVEFCDPVQARCAVDMMTGVSFYGTRLKMKFHNKDESITVRMEPDPRYVCDYLQGRPAHPHYRFCSPKAQRPSPPNNVLFVNALFRDVTPRGGRMSDLAAFFASVLAMPSRAPSGEAILAHAQADKQRLQGGNITTDLQCHGGAYTVNPQDIYVVTAGPRPDNLLVAVPTVDMAIDLIYKLHMQKANERATPVMASFSRKTAADIIEGAQKVLAREERDSRPHEAHGGASYTEPYSEDHRQQQYGQNNSEQGGAYNQTEAESSYGKFEGHSEQHGGYNEQHTEQEQQVDYGHQQDYSSELKSDEYDISA